MLKSKTFFQTQMIQYYLKLKVSVEQTHRRVWLSAINTLQFIAVNYEFFFKI